MPRLMQSWRIFSNSSRSSTAPLGLDGELMMIIRVFGVSGFSIIAAVRVKPFSSSVSTKTHLPPA